MVAGGCAGRLYYFPQISGTFYALFWFPPEEKPHESITRSGHAAEKIAIVRRFADNLPKLHTTPQPGIKNKRLRMAYGDL
jgi:hypothetical protein